jgi:transcription antitermination factor NusG
MTQPATVTLSPPAVNHRSEDYLNAERLNADRLNVDQWFAVYTRSHHEKSVAEQLRGRGIEHFLPVYASARRWKDRVKMLEMPLFTGYLFVRIFPSQFLSILQVHGVSRLVGSPKPLPLEEKEIQQLRTWLSLSLSVEPNPYLRVGQLVRVRRGPLTDVEGILIRKKNGLRLVVSIDLIQRSVALEIDASDIVLAGNGRSPDYRDILPDHQAFPDVA